MGTFVFPVSGAGAGDFAGITISELRSGGGGVSTVTDQPLTIKDDYDGLSNYTGGNAANAMMISVAYFIFNVSTGLFE
jgi:hypothetical protein